MNKMNLKNELNYCAYSMIEISWSNWIVFYRQGSGPEPCSVSLKS